jgi:hypothetical protein
MQLSTFGWLSGGKMAENEAILNWDFAISTIVNRLTIKPAQSLVWRVCCFAMAPGRSQLSDEELALECPR